MAESSQNRERARPFGKNRRYFLRGTPIGSAKVRLSILFLMLSLGWVAVAATSRERRDKVCTHGTISRAHAPWADQCDACHVPFKGENAGLFETRERWNTFRCETCHAGPANDVKVYSPHQPAKTNWNNLNAEDCTLCHKDHQGADFALSKPSDSACTQCHANLKDYRHGELGVNGDIQRFGPGSGEHPNFRVLEKKPEEVRSLKFSHAVHMTPGQTTKWKLDDLAPGMRASYQRFADKTGMITLDCTACHELDSSGTSALTPPRQSGQVFLPISHDKHCAACHDLGIGEKATQVNAKLTPFRVTHKATAEQLKEELHQKFLSQLTAPQPKSLTLEHPPGQRLDPPIPRVAQSVQAEVDRLTAETMKELFAGPATNPQGSYAGARYCQKCHLAEPGEVLTLKKTDVHPVWLTASRFNHSKHRMMDCAGCHGEKFKPLSGELLAKDELEPAGLPGIDNCRTCHAPTGKTTQGQPLGGARYGCVDCHTYHNGEHPLHGPGSPFRTPPVGRRLTIEDLLRGTPKDTPR
ncbi:multiheme c-type cytochrome [Zavarzinella formosa]|uniref:multiheme c-type cytochrome n=1 Tax=Zavarzinella formosa TaxID=360055 RepID=UPI0002DD0CAE|nr:cytochrome c3 family protein [Zavarzinella formosa]